MLAATPAHYVSLIVGFVVILYLDRQAWFLGDIFEFLARMQPGHTLDLLRAHNGHWSTVPLLITLILYNLFGLHSYTPFIATEVAVHVVLAHLLWRWMRRMGADPWVATGLVGAFLIVGGGVENLWSSFQISFVLPLALGVLGVFLVDHRSRRLAPDITFWPIGILAVMCSGIGIIVVILATLLALLRRGWLAALRVASVPAVVYLLWALTIGHEAVSQQPGTSWDLTLVPQYVWTGMTSAITATTGWSGAGALLIIALGVWLYRERHLANTEAAFAIAAAIAALLFFVILGIDRVGAGVSESELTRYGYVFIALVLPATAIALTRVAATAITGRVIIVGLCAVIFVNGMASFHAFLQTWDPITQETRGQILAAAHLIDSGAPLAAAQPAIGGDIFNDAVFIEPSHSSDLTVEIVRSMIRNGKIPTNAAFSPMDSLNASLHLQVSMTTTPIVTQLNSPPRIGNDVHPVLLNQSGGCVSVSSGGSGSQLRLVFDSPGSVKITPHTDGNIGVQLASVTRPLITQTRNFRVNSNHIVYFNVTAQQTAPLLSLLPGMTDVCGLSS